MNINRLFKLLCGLQTAVLCSESITADNSKIKRNKFFWGFDSNLKVSASNKQLWLMKVYRYLSPKKIYFFNPFFVVCKANRQTTYDKSRRNISSN